MNASAEWGVRVAGDGSAAFLTGLAGCAQARMVPAMDAVLATLQRKGVTVGIDRARIAQLLKAASDGSLDALPPGAHDVAGAAGTDWAIALAEPAVHGSDAVLHWMLPLADGAALVVVPGTLLATLVPAGEGRPGRSVIGKRINARRGQIVALQPGLGVETGAGEQVESYRARWLGLASFDGRMLSVEPTVQIDADAMQARIDVFARSHEGGAIDPEQIVATLQACGVVEGIDRAAIAEAVQAAARSDTTQAQVIVARGRPVLAGRDAQLAIQHRGNTVGQLRPHGRIDFHERDYPWNVDAGETIGMFLAARAGEDGVNVRGERLPAPPVADLTPQLEGVACAAHGKLSAEHDGALFVHGNRLTVTELLAVAGDVGVATGNVDTRTPVHVKGHVAPGFAIRSQKDVIIEHNIEDASVRAGGGLVVKGGIRGRGSRVQVPHDVQAGFIENAEVFANGDILVRASVINSELCANGAIVVGGRQSRQGSVIGGCLRARQRIEAVVLGAPSHPRTQLIVGIDSALRERLDEIAGRLEAARHELEQLDQLRERLRLRPPPDAESLHERLAVTRAEVEARLAEIGAEQAQVWAEAGDPASVRVLVHRQCHPGVQITLHDRVYEVTRETGPGEFRLQGEAVLFAAG